jgi:hypothetical protein
MKKTHLLTLSLVVATLLGGATTAFASNCDGMPQDTQVKCRFVYDDEGNIVGYCCGNDCLLP